MMFYARRLHYKHRDLTILLQNENGPCPLLAVVNALSLKGSIVLPLLQNTSCLPVATVEDILREFLNSHQRTLFPDRNMQFTIDTAIQQLSGLRNGLDVNPKFESVDSFEPTNELSIFDASRIRLVHGMTLDPQENDLRTEIGLNSYNVMIMKSTDPSAVPLFAQWQEQFPTQLTYRGLIDLSHQVAEDEICIFFRNNHFSVMTKVGGVLYTLITDVGVAQARPHAPWESLVDLTGESSVFRDANFGRAPSPPPPTAETNGTATNAGVVVAAVPIPNGHNSSGTADAPRPREAPEDDDDPPTPPRRNSQLVRRDGGDREIIMLNKEESPVQGAAGRRRSSAAAAAAAAGKPLASEFSQVESSPAPPSRQNQRNPPADDRCCCLM